MRRQTDLWIRSLLASAVWSLCTANAMAAQPAPSFPDRTFSADQALIWVYGGLEWKDQRLNRHADFRDGSARVQPVFESIFPEDGTTKRMVIGKLIPTGSGDYSCHACAPLLGGVVFRQEGNRWVRESVGELIETSSAAHSSLKLLQIGPERTALLHQTNDVNGGVETRQASVIFGVGNHLAVRFKAEGFVAPGPGACLLPEQHLAVSTADQSGEPQDYYDLIVDAQWNDATCRNSWQGNRPFLTSSGKACRRVTRHRYRDGSYHLFSTALDECRPVEENTVPAEG